MRHRRKGRRLGRSSSHRRALLRNLASALFLTERDAEFDNNPPRVKGRIETTLPKAKEVRPLVEKCITLARKSLEHSREAEKYATDAERGSDQWKQWRSSEEWQNWNAAIAPVVAARRRALRMLGDKSAVRILFDDIAPRFEDREGGYTRILKLAKPRLGDAGARALLELVGVNDREATRSEKPAFATEDDQDESTVEGSTEEANAEDASTDEGAGDAEAQASDASEIDAAEDQASESETPKDSDK